MPQAIPMSCVATQFPHNTKAQSAVVAEPLHWGLIQQFQRSVMNIARLLSHLSPSNFWG